MSEPSNENSGTTPPVHEKKTAASSSGQDDPLVPRWVKTGGAIVGIIAGLSTVVLGFYQAGMTLKQYQVKIAEENHASAEAKRKTAEEERKRTEAEAKELTALREKDLQIKQTELAAAQDKRSAAQLEFNKEVELFRMKQNAQNDQALRDDERGRWQRAEELKKELVQDLLEVLKHGENGAKLATLARYIERDGTNVDDVLVALVARLDAPASTTEINIIFQLMEKMGAKALPQIIRANRTAFDNYGDALPELFWLNVNGRPVSGCRFSYVPGVSEDPSDTKLVNILQKVATGTKADPYLRGYVYDLLSEECMMGRRRPQSYGVSGDVVDRIIKAEAKAQLLTAVLAQSKLAIQRLLPRAEGYVDLSRTDLSGLRLSPGRYTAVDFSDAYVSKMDLSSATLSDESLATLRRARVWLHDGEDRDGNRLGLSPAQRRRMSQLDSSRSGH